MQLQQMTATCIQRNFCNFCTFCKMRSIYYCVFLVFVDSNNYLAVLNFFVYPLSTPVVVICPGRGHRPKVLLQAFQFSGHP